MKVSVVSVTYNRAKQLENGLMSLLNQKVKPDEVIIIDDGSTDDTEDKVRNIESKIEGVLFNYIYLDHPAPRISCYPRNVGIKQARNDLIIFTEPEILHVGDTIAQLITHFIGNNEKYTPVATQVWTIQRKIWEKLTEDNFKRPETILNHPYAELTTNSNMENMKAPDSDWAITGSKNCLTGCLFACKKEWLEDIGGFDESFEGHGWDDYDLFERLNLYGKPIFPCDDIIVIHQWHEKNYPYNIYESAERNGTKSKERIAKGEYRANIDVNWGAL